MKMSVKGLLANLMSKVKALSDWQAQPLVEYLGNHDTAVNASNYIAPKPYRRLLIIQPTWATANYIPYAYNWVVINANQSSFTVPNFIRVADGYVLSSGTVQSFWWTFRMD